jgi:predicted RNase H-like HicB family nuclease
MKLTARIWTDEDVFLAECLELGVISQGKTADDAIAGLRDGCQAFLECADRQEIEERLGRLRPFEVPWER